MQEKLQIIFFCQSKLPFRPNRSYLRHVNGQNAPQKPSKAAEAASEFYLIIAKYSDAVITGILDIVKSLPLRVIIKSAFAFNAEKYCRASSKSKNEDCNACLTTEESTVASSQI